MSTAFENVREVNALAREASSFHARLLRMSPGENGKSRANPQVLADLTAAAERLGVVNKFNPSARGVVFIQQKSAILAGNRPLKHIEAESVAGYIAREARKACLPNFR